MLDRLFNELDNDFITIWSGILLWDEKDYSQHITPRGFVQLVKLGQINAIQAFPLFYNYDERLIKNNPHVQGLKLTGGYRNNHLQLNIMRRERRNSKKFNAQPKYSLIKVLIQELNTMMCYVCEYEISNEPIFLQECYEIKQKISPFPLRENKQLRERLEARYNAAPDNPVHAFVYAKYLHLFGKKEDKILARSILTELSQRKLSDTLLSSIQKDKENWLAHEAMIRSQYYQSNNDPLATSTNESPNEVAL